MAASIKSGVQWLVNAFGPRRASAVAAAYRQQIDPDGANGRLILNDLARYCGATRSAMAPTPHETAFNAGQQDVFFHLLEMLGLTPADFVRILMERDDAQP
jgi:hypothetical protein